MEKVFLCISAASALCAASSLPTHEYRFVYELKNWTEAQSFCREQFTDLASIENMEDVTKLNSMADLSKMTYSSYNNRAWIGLYDDVNSWKWSMSDSNFYQHEEKQFRSWSSGEPNNDLGEESCGLINANGFWNDVPCSITIKPVCFDVKGPNVTFVLINTSMNWNGAQSFCREHHTDLASVRNETENQKVTDLVPAGERVWIGLYRDTWKWSGGSSSSFRYWESGEPNNVKGNESCAATNFEKPGGWEDWSCDVKRAFICYSVPISQKVVRLKLVRSPSVDLNDPAVLEDLLKQLHQKLTDQEVDGHVKLSWKSQSDGNTFSKETKREKTQKDEL